MAKTAKNLQDFFREEEKIRPGSVIRVTEPINPNKFETIAFLKKLDLRSAEKMVLFEKVLNLRGQPSSFPLLYNAFINRQLCADALGMGDLKSPMDLSLEIAARELQKGKTTVVTVSEAPCKEVVLKGRKADLTILPIAMHHKDDCAPYLTMTCVIKGMNQDFYDVTFTKNKYLGPHKTCISAHQHHHMDTMIQEYERKDRRTPVIIVLGHHPAFYLASCCLTPFGNNDYETAAAMLQEPLRLVPSETWGKDFLVPADAEIIIEGEIPPHIRETQNPFGEIMGYYQWKFAVPVIEVKAITHRKNAVMQDVWPGNLDHWNLGGIPKEGSVFNLIKKNIPGITAIHLPPSGCGRVSAYISMRKEFPNEPRKAAMQAFVDMPNLKLAVIVDDDVNVFNEREVMWALTTRTHWDKDLDIIRKVQNVRDWLGHAVAIIDATRSPEKGIPACNEVPEAAMKRVNVSKYL